MLKGLHTACVGLKCGRRRCNLLIYLIYFLTSNSYHVWDFAAGCHWSKGGPEVEPLPCVGLSEGAQTATVAKGLQHRCMGGCVSSRSGLRRVCGCRSAWTRQIYPSLFSDTVYPSSLLLQSATRSGSPVATLPPLAVTPTTISKGARTDCLEVKVAVLVISFILASLTTHLL